MNWKLILDWPLTPLTLSAPELQSRSCAPKDRLRMMFCTMNYNRKSLMLQRLTASTNLLIFIFCLSLVPGVCGQSLGANRGDAAGSGGGRSIQGRIFGAGGTLPASGIRITLETSDSGTRTAFADHDSAFTLNNLAAGPYQVTIDAGKEYEITREHVNIEGPAPVYQLPIYLHLRPENNPAFVGVPKPAIDSYTKATEAANKGDSKKAVQYLRAALDQYPQFAVALSDLGLQYMKLNEMAEAATTYEALLKLKPSETIAHLNLGIALYNLSTSLLSEKKVDEANQKLTEAEKHLRTALALNSFGPSAHYYLGLTSIKLRHYQEAQKEMELAISNGGDNLALAHKYLGGLYMSAQRNKDAADQLEKYLQIDSKARDAEQIRSTIKDLR